jgi:hypothetical protein
MRVFCLGFEISTNEKSKNEKGIFCHMFFYFWGGNFSNILKTSISKVNYYDIIPKYSSFSFKNIVLRKNS